MLDNISESIYFMEDFVLFKNVQINKYCNEKDSKMSFKSPEWDMVSDLIKDYWCDLLATGYLNKKSSNEKEKIFYSVEIIFPYSNIPEHWIDSITYVDFASY